MPLKWEAKQNLYLKKKERKTKISQSPVQSVVTDTACLTCWSDTQRDTETSIQHGLSKGEVTSPHGHHMGFPEQGRELLMLLAPEAQAGEELHVTK